MAQKSEIKGKKKKIKNNSNKIMNFCWSSIMIILIMLRRDTFAFVYVMENIEFDQIVFKNFCHCL